MPRKRVLEIKCSYKHRDKFPKDIPEADPSYHLQMCENKLKLKGNSPWYYQVQFQMGVLKLNCCDFIIHTLQGIEIIEINFDEDVWIDMRQKSVNIFNSHIFPLL